MGKDKRYTQEYKNMIVDLYKSGMTLSELSQEYGISKSTMNGWIDRKKEIKVNKDVHGISTMCYVLGVARSTYTSL